MNADSIRIETDEDGFHLIVEPEDETEGVYRFRISDPEALYDHVKAVIGPWLYERDAAMRERQQTGLRLLDPEVAQAFADAYERSDPKHPAFHSTHADIHDMRERNPDEYEYLREESKREKAGEA